MQGKIDTGVPADHVEGGFEWAKKPQCSCGRLEHAFEEKFFFVANMTEGDDFIVYMMPVDSDGSFVRRSGVQVAHCPWCGDKIRVAKSPKKK